MFSVATLCILSPAAIATVGVLSAASVAMAAIFFVLASLFADAICFSTVVSAAAFFPIAVSAAAIPFTTTALTALLLFTIFLGRRCKCAETIGARCLREKTLLVLRRKDMKICKYCCPHLSANFGRSLVHKAI